MLRVSRRRLLASLLLAAPASAFAQRSAADAHLPPLDDLRPIAQLIARNKAPLLLLFSTPGCPFCREVRRNYLAPRVGEQLQLATAELLLREADITSQRPLIDLTGAVITEAGFATRYSVRAVPVVALFDQSLQLIAEPLVGLDRSGFYEGYLAAAIESARKRLRQTS